MKPTGVSGRDAQRTRPVRPACFGCAVGAGLAVLAGFLFANPFLGQRLTDASFDLPQACRAPVAPPEVAVVYMDEQSREELHQPDNRPWDRALHAELLRRLRDGGARIVAFDVLFNSTANIIDADRSFAAALRTHGPAVIGSHLLEYGAADPERRLVVGGVSLQEPDEIFATNAAATGVLGLIQDADTAVRRLTPVFRRSDGQAFPGLAWETARLAGAPVTRERPGLHWGVHYYGPPGTIASASYFRVLAEQGLPAGFFSNRVVVVSHFYQLGVMGANTDTFGSPFPTGKPRFDGGEVHATIVANLLRGDWLRRLPLWAELGLMALLGAAWGGVLPRFAPLRATGFAVAGMAGLGVLAVVLHLQARVGFPWLVPVLIQIPCALLWTVLFHATQARHANELLVASLSKYVPRDQVARILERPELLRPGGSQQFISIMTTDINNFSKISERMDAEDLVGLLNRYYEEAIAAVHEEDGTVVNLIGDAIFAVWNAPQTQPEHQRRAISAALALHSRSEIMNAQPGVPALVTRIGLHAGTACVGNVGSTTQFTYTAVGEAVNLSFRIEGLNKQLGTGVLATRAFLKGLSPEPTSRCVGQFRLKGFDHVVEVHEVLSVVHDEPGSRPWREAFLAALHQFQRGAFDAAARQFQATLGLRPDDGPSRFYLEWLEEHQGKPIPKDWTGEIAIREK